MEPHPHALPFLSIASTWAVPTVIWQKVLIVPATDTGVLFDTTVSALTPVSVAGAVKTFCRIAAGAIHTVAIDKNGGAWGWGLNSTGQLGDNTITNQSTPVSVAGTTKTFCQIAATTNASQAIDKYGMIWTWGGNAFGELGDNGATQNQSTPVSVYPSFGTTKTFCQISAGAYHVLALDKNGRAWGWGSNSTGQLGDNTTTDKITPVSVAGTTKTFCQIRASTDDGLASFAIDKNGRAWAWGDNSNNALGSLTRVFRTPVRVCNF